MVTKDMLEWTRSQRVDLEPGMHCTPGGSIEAEVSAWQRDGLETSIRIQEGLLERARAAMRRDRALAAQDGRARVHFNQRWEIKP